MFTGDGFIHNLAFTKIVCTPENPLPRVDIISEGGSGGGHRGVCRVGGGGVKDFVVLAEKVADLEKYQRRHSCP